MIAADTSSIVAFLQGEKTKDVENILRAIDGEKLFIPPMVIAELLSSVSLKENEQRIILSLPQMTIKTGFWKRTGEARARILVNGKKARLADSMIAVMCLDHNVPLITRDKDYRHFEQEFGLRII